ncbi:hypothetical protein X743_30850 [Mesorhizobium sp. LNHC252B00]|nr:hypothetical protein X743_30850 [Mesorhizobium sp. LNHC252B00]
MIANTFATLLLICFVAVVLFLSENHCGPNNRSGW